ncbi:hypothetical protein BOTBODRAFT_282366 [Botryobasidium botryosum FD-172 SS1]|uniref:Uncharacterized protein n=1 Tax=Botryobasidium botryosum (strain FD-172 SS1) TaxID=930990 RepID=A0A067MUN2_BOTB1|nr:hypothetical protein BOTBODRAFT_282366 [Botryobasidium botryosum FD-172 SS1]
MLRRTAAQRLRFCFDPLDAFGSTDGYELLPLRADSGRSRPKARRNVFVGVVAALALVALFSFVSPADSGSESASPTSTLASSHAVPAQVEFVAAPLPDDDHTPSSLPPHTPSPAHTNTNISHADDTPPTRPHPKPPTSTSPTSHLPKVNTCTPSSYSAGHWAARPVPTEPGAASPVLPASGFTGCAANGNWDWHLGSEGGGQMGEYRTQAAGWVWAPGDGCVIDPLDGEKLLAELVEQGGWLLIGDSVTEEHFFSLSCILHGHVIATPDFNTVEGAWDRAMPQHLYLDPSSPLIPSLHFPPGFLLEETPLVTFRRNDLLLLPSEIIEMHRNLTNATTPPMGGHPTWDIDPAEYMTLFTDRSANYRTLVVSTGGHWTQAGTFFDPAGPPAIIELFTNAMKLWMRHMEETIVREKEAGRWGGREILVRSYTTGHPDCHDSRGPLSEAIKSDEEQPWNWGWMDQLNDNFESIVSNRSHPNIYFLAIDRPSNLRPDAHTTVDCLHISVGTGVIEGWTHYLLHFIKYLSS